MTNKAPEYMASFVRLENRCYTKFKEYSEAKTFAKDMSNRYDAAVEVRNYKTDELIFTAEPRISLDNMIEL